MKNREVFMELLPFLSEKWCHVRLIAAMAGIGSQRAGRRLIVLKKMGYVEHKKVKTPTGETGLWRLKQ